MGYTVSVPALEGCHTQGDTLAEDAIRLYLEALRDGVTAIPHDVMKVEVGMAEVEEVYICKLPVQEAGG